MTAVFIAMVLLTGVSSMSDADLARYIDHCSRAKCSQQQHDKAPDYCANLAQECSEYEKEAQKRKEK